MKDYFGNELKIGDVVAFEKPRYRMLVTGTIISFSARQVRVEYETDTNGRTETYLSYPGVFIKEQTK